jgi:signal recognition particle subunit SRP54
MFDGIKEKVQNFTGLGTATDQEIEELVKEIQRELLRADVAVEDVMDLTDRIKEEAMGDVPSGLTKKEHVLKVVYDELVRFLGEEAPDIVVEPTRILLCGLFGAGKTTTAGKLARFYKQRGLSTGLIAADIHRPAAVNQLRQVADEVDAQFYGEEDATDAAAVVENGLQELDVDVVIVDSAGRDSLNQELIDELEAINTVLDPDDRYLVVPADAGQNARTQAEQFNDAINVNGVIVTKTDATAKAGGALTSCIAADVPIRFIGQGEKMRDLSVYDPVEFVSDMLGVPHLESLLEKAQEAVDEEDVEQIMEGEMTMDLFVKQLKQASETGLFSKLLDNLPMGGSIPDDIFQAQQEQIPYYDAVIKSMTDEEKQDPSIIKASRTRRIAEGSGTDTETVKELLEQYRQVENMMDRFDPEQMKRGKMGGMGNMKQMMQHMGLG